MYINAILKRIVKKIDSFLHKKRINFFKTVYINFMMFDYEIAKKMPIIIYGPCRINSTKGSIIIDGQVQKGMLRIGEADNVRSYYSKSYLDFRGKMTISHGIIIRRGIKLSVAEKGHLVIGKHSLVSDNCTIICYDSIQIGKSTSIGSDTILMDTDFHYIINTETLKIKRNKSRIIIGDNNWVGAMCTIKKGTITPKGTIVAGPYSMTSKDYSDIGENNIIAGSPAVVIRQGYRKIENLASERLLSQYFSDNMSDYYLGSVNIDSFCMSD